MVLTTYRSERRMVIYSHPTQPTQSTSLPVPNRDAYVSEMRQQGTPVALEAAFVLLRL